MLKLETFPKIDAHMHANYFVEDYLKLAKKYTVKYITINTDTSIFPSVSKQQEIAMALQKSYPYFFAYVCSFSMKNWQEPEWYNIVENEIAASVESGAVAVKVWKNIGMQVRKPDGSFLMIDSKFFIRIFELLIQRGIPLLAHLGEPRNCWLPIDQMSTARNRTYYKKHPEYHAFLHPEMPSYSSQIEARDNVLDLYPGLVLVGAHLGSMEWSIEELAVRFDKYPGFYVDCSSRLGHLQLQSVTHYEDVRNFFLIYADRIIYGTDAYDNPNKLEQALIDDWQFLATYEQCYSPEVEGSFRGLALPEKELHMIYSGNAQKIYSRLQYKI